MSYKLIFMNIFQILNKYAIMGSCSLLAAITLQALAIPKNFYNKKVGTANSERNLNYVHQ